MPRKFWERRLFQSQNPHLKDFAKKALLKQERENYKKFVAREKT